MTLKEATRLWSSRRRRYVVGYIASGNVIYHYDRWDKRRTVPFAMTRREADALLTKMPSPGCAIFELRPVATGGGAR